MIIFKSSNCFIRLFGLIWCKSSKLFQWKYKGETLWDWSKLSGLGQTTINLWCEIHIPSSFIYVISLLCYLFLYIFSFYIIVMLYLFLFLSFIINDFINYIFLINRFMKSKYQNPPLPLLCLKLFDQQVALEYNSFDEINRLMR